MKKAKNKIPAQNGLSQSQIFFLLDCHTKFIGTLIKNQHQLTKDINDIAYVIANIKHMKLVKVGRRAEGQPLIEINKKLSFEKACKKK